MDTPENNPAAQPNNPGDLREQFESLRQLVISLLVLLIVISGTLNIYLLRQWKFTRNELNAVRPQVTQMVADYNKNNAPVIADFIKKLSDFERTHPDFAPILNKYGIKPGGPTGAAPIAPAAAPKK